MTITVPILQPAADDYIFFPACAYRGNQFAVLPKDYPPMYDEACVAQETLITDVPRLAPDGSGQIEVTTGDVSVPCVGVFSPSRSWGTLVFTVQQMGGINLGLSYRKGEISVTYPARRAQVYRWPHLYPNAVPYEPLAGEIPLKVLEFPCDGLPAFFRTFFENRKCMGLDDTRPQNRPKAEVARIQIDKYNALNYYEGPAFYGVGTKDLDTANFTWQPGWVGGGLSSYALMKLGGLLEYERGVNTLRHIFRTQAKSGFLPDRCDAAGHFEDCDSALVRGNADVLYFLFKHYALMPEVPAAFEAGTRRLADAFVRLWETYGQLGHFLYVHTGEIRNGGSTSGAIAPAGLCRAFERYGDMRYLRAAEEIADFFYETYALRGFTTGGPGEALQCPDSESAFGLLESMVVLYETTREAKWLARAEYLAAFASSWVVSYNYVFPPACEFARLGIRTVGTVFANVQNKHAAPGICTLSGDSLKKLYDWTGNPLYLELITDIANAISQCMSTEERPIYSLGDHARLKPGVICERVNLSDWEGDDWVGSVFNISCWPEVSNLLTLAELPELLV